jgi:peptide/nickel transport system substrate-binding protein
MTKRRDDRSLEAYIDDLRDQHARGRITRQDFLRWGAMFGVSLPLLNVWAAEAPLAHAAEKAGAASTPQRGGTLRCAVYQGYGLDPAKLQDVASAATVHPVFEGLVRAGADLIPRPLLAESWSVSSDARTWTFKLRKGITFNNGASFTADDVVWTFQWMLDPKTAATAQNVLTYLKASNVEKIDDYTVRFHLDRPVAVFPADLCNYMIVMVPKNYSGDFAKDPTGTGPFLLKELAFNDHATFTRNPNYWRQPLPYLDGVRIIYTASETTRTNMLLAGQVDVDLLSANPLALAHKSQVKLLTMPAGTYYPFHMRVDQKPFNDNRVREAFKYVVDRAQLVKIALQGYGVTGNDHPVAPSFPEYSSNGVRKQDFAKARALLSAAGYPAGFQIDLYGVGPSGTIAPETVALKQWAASAGITINLRPEPSTSYYNHWLDVPFGFDSWVQRPEVDAMFNLAYRSGVPWNASHWSDATFDNWLAQLDATVDLTKRRAIVRKLEDYMTNQGPAIIYGFQDVMRATRLNVHGMELNPLDLAFFDQAWLSTM